MKIQRHYLINLDRCGERKQAWIALQEFFGLHLEKVTCYQAVDRLLFKSARDLYDLFEKAGLTLGVDRNDLPETDVSADGLLAYNGSILILLKVISEQADGWHVVWEDDWALKVPYDLFDRVCECAPTDAEILSFLVDDHPYPTISPNMDMMPLIESFSELRTSTESPYFYHGFLKQTFGSCFALTPSGAKQLLAIHKAVAQKDKSLLMNDLMPSIKESKELTGVYTFFTSIVKNIVCELESAISIAIENPEQQTLKDGCLRRRLIRRYLSTTGVERQI